MTKPTHLIKVGTSRVFVYSETLAERKDMVPASYDKERDSFVPFSDFEIKRPEAVRRTKVETAPIAAADETAAESAEAGPADPLDVLNKKEIADLCLEKYNEQIKLPGRTKEYVISEYRRIEAEHEKKGQNQ